MTVLLEKHHQKCLSLSAVPSAPHSTKLMVILGYRAVKIFIALYKQLKNGNHSHVVSDQNIQQDLVPSRSLKKLLQLLREERQMEKSFKFIRPSQPWYLFTAVLQRHAVFSVGQCECSLNIKRSFKHTEDEVSKGMCMFEMCEIHILKNNV